MKILSQSNYHYNEFYLGTESQCKEGFNCTYEPSFRSNNYRVTLF